MSLPAATRSSGFLASCKPMRRETCNSLYGRTQRARPTVVSEGESGRWLRYTGPLMPTHVVVPSVPRAAVLHGTAGTILVEPSAASFARPASDCGFNGLPGSGAVPAAETFGSGEGAVDVCAETFEIRSRPSNAAVVTIRMSRALLARITENGSRINRFRSERIDCVPCGAASLAAGHRVHRPRPGKSAGDLRKADEAVGMNRREWSKRSAARSAFSEA